MKFTNIDSVLPDTNYHILGLTEIEPFNSPLAHNLLYIIGRQFKLMGLRLYQFFNIFPPFWSAGHKLYYAAHMIFFLFVFGIRFFQIIPRKRRLY